MFTNKAFLELEPDLIIQLIPLGDPINRTTILHQVETHLAKEFPKMLVTANRGMIAINTRTVKNPLSLLRPHTKEEFEAYGRFIDSYLAGSEVD